LNRSQAKPSQAKPSQAKPSQAKPCFSACWNAATIFSALATSSLVGVKNLFAGVI